MAMTREEHIYQLKQFLRGYSICMCPSSSLYWKEHYEEIIKALEQEPCEDAISRQEVLDLIADYDLSMGQVVRGIHALPSVTSIRPKGHWIETAEEYYKAVNEKGGGVNENTDYFTDDIACSECLAKFSVIDNEAERFDFCPCCGSDNREVGE